MKGEGTVAAASSKEERKTEWPVWPALSLEHIAADKAKIKGKKRGTPCKHPSLHHLTQEAWCVCI